MKYTAPFLPATAPFTAEQRAWLNGLFAGLASSGAAVEPEAFSLGLSGDGHHALEPVVAVQAVPQYDQKNPFPACLVTNQRLSGERSAKDTRHVEISLEGSGLTYEVGDALGVWPQNCPDLVDFLLSALDFSGKEEVPVGKEASLSIREALQTRFDVTSPSKAFLEALAERTGDGSLRRLLQPEAKEELARFLWGRDYVDLVLAFPDAGWTPERFTGLLRPLKHRLYSISSSLKACPGQVHLTVGTVRYAAYDRPRKGVCSTFLADRITGEEPLPVFVHPNPNFRLPGDTSAPVVMIGPGTGIAPFRAFLQERRATGAPGKNWLFFGDQHAATDFLYRDELDALRADGVLTRLDTAFSRDQAEKIYVQHLMVNQAKELYAWLEDGAHLYVCGDAGRMAKDVDATLHQVIETAGGCTPEASAAYVQRLKKEKRYARDVY
jgi:sulfite reductase (NADPH) flavoprotein alpha-component